MGSADSVRYSGEAEASPELFKVQRSAAVKKFVSIDIETLGLEPDVCDVIEFGAVIDDPAKPISQLPHFHCYVLPPKREVNGKVYEFYRGEPFAMQMHKDILYRIIMRKKDKEIGDKYTFLEPQNVGGEFAAWLLNNGFPWKDKDEPVKIKVAGKNFEGFDMRFLRRLPRFHDFVTFHHRVHNPAQLYFDRKKDDDLPSLDTCLRRAGIDSKVTHNAVDDALDVIRCLRAKWGEE